MARRDPARKPLQTGPAQTLIHIADINLAVPHMQAFHDVGVKRVVAFSSTSMLTKVKSTSAFDLAQVDRLQRAEDALTDACQKLGMTWTILRPTMIYGGLRPRGVVNEIARVIRVTGGWFPLVGDASGLRQPVHAADLAIAAIQASESEKAANRAFNLSGAEKLTFKHMVEKIFQAMDRKPRIIRVPVTAFRVAIFIAQKFPRYSHISTATALRMLKDMSFDHSEASEAFGYSPVSFIPFQTYPNTP